MVSALVAGMIERHSMNIKAMIHVNVKIDFFWGIGFTSLKDFGYSALATCYLENIRCGGNIGARFEVQGAIKTLATRRSLLATRENIRCGGNIGSRFEVRGKTG